MKSMLQTHTFAINDIDLHLEILFLTSMVSVVLFIFDSVNCYVDKLDFTFFVTSKSMQFGFHFNFFIIITYSTYTNLGNYVLAACQWIITKEFETNSCHVRIYCMHVFICTYECLYREISVIGFADNRRILVNVAYLISLY